MLAITARVIDDREGRTFGLAGTSCGKLQKDTLCPEEKDLALREACNKIIHAEKLRVDLEEGESGQSYLNPYIYIYGRQRGTEWKATIDVIVFAKEYVSCVSRF